MILSKFTLFVLFFTACAIANNSSIAATLNGFDLNNASIPVDKILRGGPAKDGIPALDQPKHLNAKDSTELKEDDIVLGVVLNKIARAYPIRIMNWHEIVNDTIANKKVVITYCPLCGSGLIFDSNINGTNLNFGVSGLLYNSDVLLYDRKTESLWSQLEAKAITGFYNGKKLETIPVQQTTWKRWKQQYPNTQVLSFNTGYARNYSRNPYAGYDVSEQLYFPLKFRSQGLHPKQKVIGIVINGEAKAWPFNELRKVGGQLKDNVGNKTIFIDFDASNNSAKILDKDQQILSGTTLFWFAWSAFHPQTTLFKH